MLGLYRFYHNQVQELRKLIGGNADLPIEHLSIILRGNVLHDNKNGIEEFIQLKNGGIIFYFNFYVNSIVL